MNMYKDNLNQIVVLSKINSNDLLPIIDNLNTTHNVTNIVIDNSALQSEVTLMHEKLSEVKSPFVIIANSYNSFPAIYYAKMYSKKVKHIILIGCLPFNDKYVTADETSDSSKLVSDIIELRRNDKLIETITQLKCPITFLHGKQDTNPYEGVLDVLNENDVDFEFILYDKCGANPWNEPASATSFYKMLNILIDEF